METSTSTLKSRQLPSVLRSGPQLLGRLAIDLESLGARLFSAKAMKSRKIISNFQQICSKHQYLANLCYYTFNQVVNFNFDIHKLGEQRIRGTNGFFLTFSRDNQMKPYKVTAHGPRFIFLKNPRIIWVYPKMDGLYW